METSTIRIKKGVCVCGDVYRLCDMECCAGDGKEWCEDSLPMFSPEERGVILIRDKGFYSLSKSKYYNGILSILNKNVYPSTRVRGSVGSMEHSGIKHGSLVHSQIEQYVKLGAAGVDANAFDACAINAINWMNQNNLRPISSEYIVYSDVLEIATSIDLLVVNPESQILAVELKTGYSGNKKSENKTFMKPPFHNIKDSVVNRHWLQLLMSLWLFANTPEGRAPLVIEPYGVLYCDETSATLETIPLEANGMSGIMSEFFARFLRGRG